MIPSNSPDLKHMIQRVGTFFDEGSQRRRRRLKNRRFTILSNDCWGAEVYKDLGLPFLTPLIGTFLADPCFLKLSQDAERLLRSELSFVPTSRYEHVNALRERIGAFPIGVLDGGELEVQFMHFASENEAAEKWSRRLGRTHFDRLFFKFSANSDPTFDIEYLRRFDALDIRKIALSKTSYPEFPSVVTIPEYIVDGKAMYPISLRHFDIVNWLDQP